MEIFTCPRLFVDDETEELLAAWQFWDKGFLPGSELGGGPAAVDELPAVFLDAMLIIDGEMHTYRMSASKGG